MSLVTETGRRRQLDIPSLDGLRAVAVMIVFVGHGFTAPAIWPGHSGVTIFFFLSGYLITTLLRMEYERSGRIALGKFYLRRALRILPPAYVTIALAITLGIVGFLPSEFGFWGVTSEILNFTNYYMISVDGDAGLPAETSMLWSLAVEEHFYLIFPALLIALLGRKLTYRRIGFVLLGACALALVWRVVLLGTGSGFYRLYISSDTRFDGLLAGAALALLANPALEGRPPLKIPPRIMNYVMTPAAVVIFALAAIAPYSIRFTVADTVQYLALVPIFWFVISVPESRIGKFLNNRVVARIGVLSFSIYLLHRIVLALVGPVVTVDLLADAAALAITLVAAQLMFFAVERPSIGLRRRLESKLG